MTPHNDLVHIIFRDIIDLLINQKIKMFVMRWFVMNFLYIVLGVFWEKISLIFNLIKIRIKHENV